MNSRTDIVICTVFLAQTVNHPKKTLSYARIKCSLTVPFNSISTRGMISIPPFAIKGMSLIIYTLPFYLLLLLHPRLLSSKLQSLTNIRHKLPVQYDYLPFAQNPVFRCGACLQVISFSFSSHPHSHALSHIQNGSASPGLFNALEM